MIYLKTKEEILRMQESASVVASVLSHLKKNIEPGLSTMDIEKEGLSFLNKKYKGVIPAFKGYMGFPAAFCISINEEIVHGIPSDKRILKDGDLVSIDFGVLKNKYYGDSAISIIVGKDLNNLTKLVDLTTTSLENGIKKALIGNKLSNIATAIENTVKKAGYSVVRDFVGHGIGRSLHEDPQVPNYYTDYAENIDLKEGLVIAIEPMVNIGSHEVEILDDQWTVVTKDRSVSAHVEHTIAITKEEPIILTRRN